jgi:hypothetical protein
MAINQLLKRMSDFYPPVTVRGLVHLRQTFVRRCRGASVGRKIATRGTLSVTNVTSLVFIFDLQLLDNDPPLIGSK